MNIKQIIQEELRKVFSEADYYDRYPDFLDPQFNPQMGAYPPVGMHAYGTMVNEEEIDEAAMRVNELPETTALFESAYGLAGYSLTLYDPVSKKAFATIGVSFDPNEGPGFHVSRVAAEKGFGPFIYELAMMHIDGGGEALMPSRDGDVRGEAFSVWEKFYNRNDVDKETIDLYSDYFRCDIITGNRCFFDDEEDKKEWWNAMSDEDKRALEVFNTKYSMEQDSDYYDLIERGKNYPKKVKIEADKAGENLWEMMY